MVMVEVRKPTHLHFIKVVVKIVFRVFVEQWGANYVYCLIDVYIYICMYVCTSICILEISISISLAFFMVIRYVFYVIYSISSNHQDIYTKSRFFLREYPKPPPCLPTPGRGEGFEFL